MTWVRTEDSMPLHPKILRLSDGAFRLWENGLHFANRATTDGRIDKALVPTLNHHGRWTPKQVASFVSELVPSLWVDCGDHYQIHDYEHHQYEATKARVESKRANWRGKKRRQRDESDETGRDVPGGQHGGLTAGPDAVSTPPTRPDPSRSVLRTPSACADSPTYDPALGIPAPKPAPADDIPTSSEVRQALGVFEAAWTAAMGSPLGLVASRETQRAIELVRWARAARPDAPLDAIRDAAVAACADDGFRRLGGPWAAFCASPGRHLATGKPRAVGADADLLVEQQAAQAEYDRAISEHRHEDARRHRADVEAIAAKRRVVRAQAPNENARGRGPRRIHA